MRLIDADALRVWHPVGRPDIIKPEDVANAPTVSCEECAKKLLDCSIRTMALRLYGGRDFGCAYFERRAT